ncbi:FAD-dependent oxidoreductase [Massilia sp. Se16.2.3]|uniref:FAD-dependent oxidoreductase n=1 Tax=Massilia sp. Se16.2.3 TaxID=2709303 RepID=UPI001E3AB219|nr:FAD-dependent oxidoreductase [Massilia sp. Se16.2.3]
MQQLGSIVSPSDFAWRDAGKLVVYRSAKVFDAAARKANGGAIWSAAECAEREPAPGAARHLLAGGIHNAGEAVADCHAFCTALAARIGAHPRFRGFIQAEVVNIAATGGRVVGLDTTAGAIGGDAFVLAAGIESRHLAAHLGVKLPLYPLKGYSLTAPIRTTDTAPQISVTDFERKVLYARIGDKLRVAAMVDMVGEDLRLNPKRIGSLTRQVQETMPHAADYSQVSAWAGLRPATPNSAPIIGASPLSNLWLNVGHGPLGFTFAAGSARILTDLMLGKAPPFALDMLALQR